MDPTAAWNNMLTAFAAKQWQDAYDHAVALQGWLQRGGFPPQPAIGTTTGQWIGQLDAEFSRAIRLAATQHVIERCQQEDAWVAV